MAEPDQDATQSSAPAAGRGSRRSGENAQFAMLNRLRREHARVDVYLVTGTRLQGRVQSFDGRSLLLQTESGGLLLYHHAISSIQPSEARPRMGGGGAPGRARPMQGPPRERSFGVESGLRDRSFDEPAERPLSMHRKTGPAPVVVTRKRSRIASLQRDDTDPPKDD